MKNAFLYLILSLIVVGCKPKTTTVDYAVDPYNREVVVHEVLQANAYSYLLVNENESEYWIAVTKMEVKEGTTYYFSEAMEMNDFHSKDLDRTFASILFVGNLSDKPIPAAATVMQKAPHSEGRPKIEKKDVKIEPVDGSITLAELFENQTNYNGKLVKVVGEIVKYNTAIMGKNWAHIQDGSGKDGYFDLTVTTMDELAVGDVVIFEGVITLSKDFGSGYAYDIIMEDAKSSKISIQ